MRDQLRPPISEMLAAYLRGGTLIFALMEHVPDVLGDAFAVPGGSGIRSDGFYYWRQDAANYVETYGVGLPQGFLDHCARQSYEAPALSQSEVAEVDAYLVKLLEVRSVGPDS